MYLSEVSVGESLRKLRKQAGLTQNEFSKKIGISRTYLSDLEADRNSPSLRTLSKIAEGLGMNLFVRFDEKTQKN